MRVCVPSNVQQLPTKGDIKSKYGVHRLIHKTKYAYHDKLLPELGDEPRL